MKNCLLVSLLMISFLKERIGMLLVILFMIYWQNSVLLMEILLDCNGVGWKDNRKRFIGDFVSDFVLKRKNTEDISHFIYDLLVLLMIVFF